MTWRPATHRGIGQFSAEESRRSYAQFELPRSCCVSVEYFHLAVLLLAFRIGRGFDLQSNLSGFRRAIARLNKSHLYLLDHVVAILDYNRVRGSYAVPNRLTHPHPYSVLVRG